MVIKPRGVTLVQWVIFVPGRFLEEKHEGSKCKVITFFNSTMK